MVNTILAKRVNHIVAKGDHPVWPKGSKSHGFSIHCEIVVDNEKVKRETARYVKLPQIIDFTDKDGNDRMQEEIQANYDRIRQEVRQIVEDEITRIKNDPELCHLIKEEE